MLEKVITYDHSITEDGSIQVRQITRILEDGKEISKTFHRHVVSPGDSLVGQDEKTVAIAGVVHTKDVVVAYKAAIAEALTTKEPI